jgi:hypothetical protein
VLRHWIAKIGVINVRFPLSQKLLPGFVFLQLVCHLKSQRTSSTFDFPPNAEAKTIKPKELDFSHFAINKKKSKNKS